MKQFVINYNNGYEVGIIMLDTNYGHSKYFPLRNFGERQGDALIFRDADCQSLEEATIKLLIKQYTKKKQYIRITKNKFIIK